MRDLTARFADRFEVPWVEVRCVGLQLGAMVETPEAAGNASLVRRARDEAATLGADRFLGGEMALDASGRILGMRFDFVSNLGAYLAFTGSFVNTVNLVNVDGLLLNPPQLGQVIAPNIEINRPVVSVVPGGSVSGPDAAR